MKQILLAVCASLALAGCAANGGPTSILPPAPLSQTTVDEKALTLAAQTVDALALSTSALVKTGVLKGGTPTALAMADALDAARDGVNLAAAAREAGNANDYATAIAKVGAAIAQVRTLLVTGD